MIYCAWSDPHHSEASLVPPCLPSLVHLSKWPMFYDFIKQSVSRIKSHNASPLLLAIATTASATEPLDHVTGRFVFPLGPWHRAPRGAHRRRPGAGPLALGRRSVGLTFGVSNGRRKATHFAGESHLF